MYWRRYIFWFIVISHSMVIEACTSQDHCQRQSFYEHQNVTYLEKVIVRYESYPSNLCRRLCRQYLECFQYSLEWEYETFGKCIIYNGVILYTDLLVAPGISMFMPCPPNFDWDKYVNKCYSSQVMGPANASTAIQECKDMFPKAQLPEPRNSLENERIRVRWSGNHSIWLGIYRPSSSNEVSDIRYNSDGNIIQYAEWETDQPNNWQEAENCVWAYHNGDTLVWYDKFCSYLFYFVCEIW